MKSKNNSDITAYIAALGMLIILVPILAEWDNVKWITTFVGIMVAAFSDQIADIVIKGMKK